MTKIPEDVAVKTARYLSEWGLTEDGRPAVTATSYLFPVVHAGTQAILKISADTDECRGNALMAWWDGSGAAPVINHDRNAILLERAMGPGSLAQLSLAGDDDDATRVICVVAAQLHSHKAPCTPDILPLEDWFDDLLRFDATAETWLTDCAHEARNLLAEQADHTILHGDLHHGNILDFGPKGWLAIDPKGLRGERAADFAALFLNPDLAEPDGRHVTASSHFVCRVQLVSTLAGLDPIRLLRWIRAWSALSAVWFLEDGLTPLVQRQIVDLASTALER
ncbi:aminoglycoside phosphotransferase family protein [Nguyenibacter vanlangensis]|uniref:Aminoglycoside phosphotransferase family protein n=1 Tax=Nguyenibacter vanlangensis TaxID=1216886 RepID=A0ABZ3D8L1_9PROT